MLGEGGALGTEELRSSVPWRCRETLPSDPRWGRDTEGEEGARGCWPTRALEDKSVSEPDVVWSCCL